MRFKNTLLCCAAYAALSVSAAGLSPTGYFTPECLESVPTAEFRADMEAGLECARKAAPDIETLCAALEKHSSPRLNAVKKRAEIFESLLGYASRRLAAGSTEMLLYSWSTKEEIRMLLDYFEAEAKLLEELKALPAPVIFSVKESGAKGDGKTDDGPAIRKAIETAIASGKPAKVFFSAGTYRIEPEKNPPESRPWTNRMTGVPTSWEREILWRAHLRLLNPEHLTLEGEPKETRLLFTDPTLCGVRILGGYHTTLRNLTLDYETLPFTQGRIVAADPETSSLELEIDPGFPLPDLPHLLKAPSRRITPVDPGSRTYLPGTYPLGKVDALGNRRFRIEAGNFRATDRRSGLIPGNLAVITGRYDSRRANTVNSMLSQFDVYENVILHSSPSWSFLIFSEAAILTGCRVERTEGSSRLASGNGDGVMNFPARIGPYLEDCHFSSTEDDGINLAASTAVLNSVSDGGLRVKPEELMQPPGVLVIDGNTGEVKAAARVVMKNGVAEFSPPLPASVNSRESLSRKPLTSDEQRERKTMYRKERVVRPDVCHTLDRSFGGSALVNCSFRNIRGLGVQLTASSVRVENCLFDTLTGAGIDVTALAPWGMYFSARNSVILNCTIRNAANGIRVKYIPPYSDGVMLPHSISGITIENNTIETVRDHAIHLENCSDILLRGNQTPGRIYLNHFSDVTAQGNVFPDVIFADPAEKNKLQEK